MSDFGKAVVVSIRIVVAGAAGFIGSQLCRRLVDDDHDVVGIDMFLGELYSADLKREHIAEIETHPQFELVEADLRTADLDGILTEVDVVINEAAIPGLRLSWENLDLYLQCNVTALGRLLDASQRAGVSRFIQASTSSVYGRTATGGEDSPTGPVSPYGVTKLAAENLVRAYADMYGLDWVILRYFSVYGPHQRPDMAYNVFCEAILDGTPIEIRGDGLQTRTNTYIDDCVDATVRAVTRAKKGTVYNIAGNDPISVLDAISILARHLGEPIPELEFVPAERGDQRHTNGDTALAEQDFGPLRATPIEEGLRRQAQWHLERRLANADPSH